MMVWDSAEEMIGRRLSAFKQADPASIHRTHLPGSRKHDYVGVPCWRHTCFTILSRVATQLDLLDVSANKPLNYLNYHVTMSCKEWLMREDATKTPMRSREDVSSAGNRLTFENATCRVHLRSTQRGFARQLRWGCSLRCRQESPAVHAYGK